MDSAAERWVRRLRDEGQKTALFFEGLTPAEWHASIYQTGSAWKARDILGHFVSAEGAFHRLFDDIRHGGGGAPADFDINEFNETEVASLREMEPPSLLQAFRTARARTIAVVSGLSPEERARRGRHPWFGDVPIEEMIQLIYRHTMIHLRDIRKALETGQPVPHRESAPPRTDGGESA
jgi:uncharacterized protein (TIGR03083 family)